MHTAPRPDPLGAVAVRPTAPVDRPAAAAAAVGPPGGGGRRRRGTGAGLPAVRSLAAGDPRAGRAGTACPGRAGPARRAARIRVRAGVLRAAAELERDLRR